MWAREKQGFTIVELLIVIVVIAILASVTVMAYSGTQSRAKTAAGKALVNTVLKKGEFYYANKGVYVTSITQFDEFNETKLQDSNSIYVSCTPWTLSTYSTTPAAAGGLSAGAADGRRIRVCGSTTGGNGYYWDYASNAEVATHYGQ